MIHQIHNAEDLFPWLVKITSVKDFKGICPTHVTTNELCLHVLSCLTNGMEVVLESENDTLLFFSVATIKQNVAFIYLFYVNEISDKTISQYFEALKAHLRKQGVSQIIFNSNDFRPSFRRWATKQGAVLTSVQYSIEV